MRGIASSAIKAILALLLASLSPPTIAGGVVECNRCPSTASAAISKGNGLTVVVDFERAEMTAYEVEYDRELRRWRTMRTAVPTSVSAAFYRIMDAASLAPSSTSHKVDGNSELPPANVPTQTLPDKDRGGLVVTVHPDNPQLSNPTGFTFPDAYRDYSASDIVLSSTARTRFGQYLAEGLAGASTGNAAWNSVAFSIQELALSWASKHGAGAIVVVVHWRDGSRTVYKVTTDNVTEAKYVEGESRDALGNKFPDATIAAPSTAPGYVGDYYFGEGSQGSRNLGRWLESARRYGIPITGSSERRNRMLCSWDGRTINCRVH
ncbi:MAG: hypothetical protein ACN6RK_12975 [Stenotrophomonas sp.]|jgi:hypothetical protein